MSQELSVQYVYDRRHLVVGLVSIFLVYFTMAYFLQALNIARPKIAADLGGMDLYAWSVSLPGLVGAFVTLIFGKLSDIYGRRIMMLIAVAFALLGSVLCALSPNFVLLVAAICVGSLGTGAMMPLVFSVVGDMFPPVERSKWIGMLQLPMGIAALFGPALGGWFADTLGWRYFFWSTVPLLALCLALVPLGIPAPSGARVKRKIDYAGSVWMVLASSALIIGISLAGGRYAWGSPQIVGLLAVSLGCWVLFFRTEYGAEEPVLDPLVLRNRSFNTVAAASFLSFFGQMAMMMYFPMFLQGVQGIGAARSGWIFTPYSVLMAFIGVPVGFLLARTKRYKWMYVAGYGIVTADMFAVAFLGESTPALVSLAVAALAGLGLGAIPTVNTVVVQNAVPRRLLGSVMGAIFFCLMLAVAVSPAILGAVMNAGYVRTLAATLPEGLGRVADAETMADLTDSQVLLSQERMGELEQRFRGLGAEGAGLFAPTVEAIRAAMQAGLKRVFWLGAFTMLAAFLIILTIPEVPIGSDPPPGQPGA